MNDDDYYYYEDDAYGDYYGEAEETWETPLQTKYDDAKAAIESNPTESVRLLTEVMAEDPEHGLWTFKCLKKLARASRNAKQYAAMMDFYKQLMAFSSPGVDASMHMKAMAKFIDKAARLPREPQLEAIELTLAQAQQDLATCGKLWLSTMLAKTALLVEAGETATTLAVLRQAVDWCCPAHVSGNEVQLCSLYAMLLQGYNATGQFTLARETYFAAMNVDTTSGAPVPQRVLASILEWGGHMYLRDGDWHAAHRAFNTAFRQYNDCGDAQATTALKFAVVADMICGSPIDAFSANESKASADSPAVQPVVRLLSAFLKNDVAAAVSIVGSDANSAVFVADAQLTPYVEPLLFRLRLNVLTRYVQSFSTVALSDVAARLCLDSVEAASDICNVAILQRFIVASIDDTTDMLLVHNTAPSAAMRRADALLLWSNALTSGAI